MVEELDTYFRNKYAAVKVSPDATINTESPAWALDRLSILALKIWHMTEEVSRQDADEAHRENAVADSTYCCNSVRTLLRRSTHSLPTSLSDANT